MDLENIILVNIRIVENKVLSSNGWGIVWTNRHI
jgi:hypothetical protein